MMKFGPSACILLLAVVISARASVGVEKEWCTSTTYCSDGYSCCPDEIHCCPTGLVCCYSSTRCCKSLLTPFVSSSQARSQDNAIIEEVTGTRGFSDLQLDTYPKSYQISMSQMKDEEKREFVNRKFRKDPVIIIYNN